MAMVLPCARGRNGQVAFSAAVARAIALPREGRGIRRPARRGLARLAVRLVLPAVRAVLAELNPVGVVAAVLARDVVAVLALLTSQRDLRPDVCRSHECLSSDMPCRCSGQASACPQW